MRTFTGWRGSIEVQVPFREHSTSSNFPYTTACNPIWTRSVTIRALSAGSRVSPR